MFEKIMKTKAGSADDLTAQADQVKAQIAARGQLEAAAEKAASERQSAEGAFRAGHDPVAALDTSPEQVEAAKRRFLRARQAHSDVLENLAALPSEADLKERLRVLILKQSMADQERIRSEYIEDLREFLRLGYALRKVQAALIERHAGAAQRWPDTETLPDGQQILKGAGLANIGFPQGIFDVVPTDIGPKCVLDELERDAVEAGFGEVLEPFRRSELETLIASDKQRRKPRWFAKSPQFDTYRPKRL